MKTIVISRPIGKEHAQLLEVAKKLKEGETVFASIKEDKIDNYLQKLSKLLPDNASVSSTKEYVSRKEAVWWADPGFEPRIVGIKYWKDFTGYSLTLKYL